MRARDFSLLEVMVAVALLVVAIFGTMAALGLTSQLRQTSRETDFMAQQLQDEIERLRAMQISIISSTVITAPHSSYTTFPISNPSDFSFPGTPVGEVKILSERDASDLFQTDHDGDGTLEIGGDDDYDLDGDGTAGEDDANSDRSTYYSLGMRILPIEVRITWTQTTGGTRQMTAQTMLYPTDTSN